MIIQPTEGPGSVIPIIYNLLHRLFTYGIATGHLNHQISQELRPYMTLQHVPDPIPRSTASEIQGFHL